MDIKKVSKKEIFESWRSFFSYPLKEDLCTLLTSQLLYLIHTASKHQVLSINQNIEEYGNDLGKICTAISDYRWEAGILLAYNIPKERTTRDNKYTFRFISNYLQLNKNIRDSLIQDLKDKNKENDLPLIIKRFDEMPRIAAIIKHQRNLLEHQSQDINDSSLGFFLTFLGNITRLLELVFIGNEDNIRDIIKRIEEARSILEKNIILNGLEEIKISEEEKYVFNNIKNNKTNIDNNKKITKKDLTVDYKINELNDKFITMSESISELILNIDNNIKNSNKATMNAIDTVHKRITESLETTNNNKIIEREAKEKTKDVIEEPELDDITIELAKGLGLNNLSKNSGSETITNSGARLELTILRDTIRQEYESKNIKLLGYENICQMPILDLILSKNIRNIDAWKESVDNLETMGKKYKRYSDHKKIMDEQIQKYWHKIIGIIDRIE